MKKIIPIPSYKEIPENPELPPDMNYVYFENGEKYPLQTKETNYSPVNAWWFSECSFLAYCHPGFARMAYHLAGFENFKYFEKDHIKCMVVWNKECILVSFRGSELTNISAFHNYFSNFDTKPVPFEQGGKVHQGFAKALDKVWKNPTGVKIFLDQLLEENPKRILWFTGHSLGGALAGLAFTKHDSSFGLYTFGAPRYGDQEFVALSAAKTSWRIVNNDDPVPLVPPDLPKIDFIFRHLGKLVHLTEKGQPIMDKEEPSFDGQSEIVGKTILKQFKRTFSILNNMKKRKNHTGFLSQMSIFNRNIGRSITEWKHYFEGLNKLVRINVQDHMPIYYGSHLWNELNKTKD